tara:strand:- start:445 stop:792 length:348 start_codon:yes stop_codon:yes gene_type:complete
MTNEQKARKFAEDFCSVAGESYDDIMEDYNLHGQGLPDHYTSGVFNACDIDSLESDVKGLLDEYQPLLEYILFYGFKGLLPNMDNELNAQKFGKKWLHDGTSIYEITKKLYAGEE